MASYLEVLRGGWSGEFINNAILDCAVLAPRIPREGKHPECLSVKYFQTSFITAICFTFDVSVGKGGLRLIPLSFTPTHGRKKTGREIKHYGMIREKAVRFLIVLFSH